MLRFSKRQKNGCWDRERVREIGTKVEKRSWKEELLKRKKSK